MNTISYTPFANTKSMWFEDDEVKQVYYGQLNSCRCGCTGEYYKPGDADFEATYHNAIKELNDANAREVRGEIWADERYLEVETSAYYDEHDEEINTGYAIYLKK